MKVILLQDVKGIGRRNEIKSVSDGYARNFLLPRKFAVLADLGGLEKKAETDIHERALLDGFEKEQETLSNLTLTFKVNVGTKGEVFGSVPASLIEKALQEKGFKEATVELNHSLRDLGTHEVAVLLGRGIKGKVKVIVSA